MKHFATTAALAVGVTLGGAVTASAALFDFTAQPFISSVGGGGSPYAGSVGGFDFQVFATPDNLTFNVPGPDSGIDPLAGDGDGLGIIDDEVSTGGESVEIRFDQQVTLTGLYFLDLFSNTVGNGEAEQAFLSIDGGAPISFDGVQPVGVDPNFGAGFLAATGLSLTGTSFLFSANVSNDGVGLGDFALAGIEIAPIPLPASVLLLGGALGGLGLMRRRRS